MDVHIWELPKLFRVSWKISGFEKHYHVSFTLHYQREKDDDDNSLGHEGVPVVVQWKWIWLGSMRIQVQSLALFRNLGIRHCCELQTQLGSSIAVALASLEVVAPIWPLAWELSYATTAALKKKKKKSGQEFTLILMHMSLEY